MHAASCNFQLACVHAQALFTVEVSSLSPTTAPFQPSQLPCRLSFMSPATVLSSHLSSCSPSHARLLFQLSMQGSAISLAQGPFAYAAFPQPCTKAFL